MEKQDIQKAGQKKYKYRLEEIRLQKFHMDTTIDAISKQLNGITKKTYDRDRKALIGSRYKIPDSRLRVYAQAFQVEIADLFNEPINQEPIMTDDEGQTIEASDIADQFEIQ